MIATAINADTTLSALGITASWSSGNSFFTITSNSVNPTQYAQIDGGHPTESGIGRGPHVHEWQEGERGDPEPSSCPINPEAQGGTNGGG